jgi:hypothetical protein
VRDERCHHGDGEYGLAGIERAEHQPADTQPELQRDPRRPELQRRFEERDGEHHPQPHEDRGDRDR